MGQAGDEIKAEVLEACAARMAEKFTRLFGRVQPAYRAKLLIRESLCADAEPVDAGPASPIQKSLIGRARRHFHRELDGIGTAKPPPQCVENARQAHAPGNGRRASAEINRIHGKREQARAQPTLAVNGGEALDFFDQRGECGVNGLAPLHS